MAKAVKLDHHHFGVAPDDPSFDIDRARKAHADVMRRWDDPKEGDAFKALMLHTIQNATAAEIETHRKEIQKFLDTYFGKKHEATAKAIVKSYVALHYDAVNKAEGDFWRHQPRDPEGQWSRINYGSQQPGHVDLAAHRELLRHAATISAATTGRGRVVYHVEDKKGRVRQERLERHRVPRLRRGERLVGKPYGEFSGNDLTVGEHSYNLIGELGGGDDTARRIGGGAQATSDFSNAWHEHENKNYGTNKGAGFARIGAGAEALHTIAGGHPKAAVAVAIGRYVGKHGAEAEKVLGPHARKSAYKYRGVERAPRDLPRKPEGMSEQQYRDRMVAQISRNIPTRAVHDLNLASGYTAPSHGYLIDSKGKVNVEAHGYGDDHYLPFRLSGLTRLRNGSYIRTRGTGGPTTEDIYAASISGAKDFTVTSRQGTYTLAFDEAFHHHKRFGDIALGMSKRYGKILDAVASGKVYAKGEVSDRAYQKMYQEALGQIPADDPNRNERAQKLAETMRDQQESVKGRPLTLNGEGYDYALKALQSQYPHYLHYADRDRTGGERLDARGDPTGYFGPNDRRFWEDPEAEEGGHLSRIGNRSERDSGYVKARHLKSADALLGYFDPSIEGSAYRENNERPQVGGRASTNISETNLTGSKLRGDVVHYQNWKHNPYNTGAVKVPGGRPADRQDERPNQQPPRRDAQQGSGRPDFANGGLDADGLEHYRKVLALKKNGSTDPNIVQWASNGTQGRDEFALAWDKDRHGTKNFVADVFSNSGLTDTKVLPDETPDAAKDRAEAQTEHTNLRGELSEPGANKIREQLQAGADRLRESNKDFAGIGHNADRYHKAAEINRKALMAEAFPAPADRNEAGMKARAQVINHAHTLLNAEQSAWKIEREHHIDVPYQLEEKTGLEGTGLEHVGMEPIDLSTLKNETTRATLLHASSGADEYAQRDARAAQLGRIDQAVMSMQEHHRKNRPHHSDVEAEREWKEHDAAIDDVSDKIADAEANAEDKGSFEAAQRAYNVLLNRDVVGAIGHPGIAQIEDYDTGKKAHQHLSDLRVDPSLHHFGKKQKVGKAVVRWTVRKSGKEYVLSSR